MALGKTIGGEPVIADLAKDAAPAVAGTTGSGKSVAINTMILSLLYRLTPAGRLIMIDPKIARALGLRWHSASAFSVVTDPKKAVVALKWTVRGDGRALTRRCRRSACAISMASIRASSRLPPRGEAISAHRPDRVRRATGEAMYETEEFEPEAHAHIVVIIDEMADLMMVGRQGHRRCGAAPGADGACGRHSCHHGDPAPVGRMSSPARSRPTSRHAFPSR